MSRTIETTVYKYLELTDRAQAKARDWYREAGANDDYYSEYVIEDASTIAGLIGISFDQRDGKPAIYWSGFSSQGDGASFEGRYAAPETGTALERVKEYAPTDERLHVIAAALDELQARYSNQLSAHTYLSGHRYYHSNMMQIDALDAAGDDIDVSAEDEAELLKTLRQFADWIYLQLEAAYEWGNSDEHVAETIEANGYEFTADGRRA